MGAGNETNQIVKHEIQNDLNNLSIPKDLWNL